MPFIRTIPEREATGPVAELYEAERARVGTLPNFVRAFSHRPDVYRAWRGLIGAVTAAMEPRRYELATLAAARQLGSSYCMLAHGSVLAREILDPAATRAVALDHRDAGLGLDEVAVMDFAEKVARDAASVTDADVGRLRDAGLSDAEIFDVAAAAAARCFFSTLLDALGVQPDSAYAALEPELREVLTIGRPIASG